MKKPKFICSVWRLSQRWSALVIAIIMLFGVSITAGGVCIGIETVEWIAGVAISKIPLETVPYALETQPPYTVVVDAGHGNFDIGAGGVIKELPLCEKTSEALINLLKDDKNFRPVRTRQIGEDPSTTERARVAIEARASLLISIHGNSDKSYPNARGFECYPSPPGRLYHNEAMRFATIIASEMKNAGHKLRGGGTGIRFAYYYGKQKRIVDSSETAVRKQKSFTVVEAPLCPAVLVEQCFISNSEDAKEWGSDKGCVRAANIYYNAICEYFGLKSTLQS